MKPDYNLCDVCGKQTKAPTICVTTDRKMDGAGSMDDVCEMIDLCPKCSVEAIHRLVDSHERAQGLIAWVRRAK